jgi:ABC-2 type transport system permease protein
MTLGIWLVRVDNLWILSENVTQIARFPLDIYQSAIRRLLTYALPLAFLALMPASQLVRGFDPAMVGLGLVWAFVFAFGSRWFWRFGLRHYTSASS